MMGLAVEVRRRSRDGGQRFDLADQIVPMNRITSTHRSLQHTRRGSGMKMRTLLGAMEAAAVADERDGPLAHSGLENAARFPQLPQPAPPDTGQPTGAGYTLAAPLLGLEYGVHLIPWEPVPPG
jgi:hypothetical protein